MQATWTLQDAKNRFSAVVDAAEKGEPQVVTKRGRPAVVVVEAAEFERLRARGAADDRASALRSWLDQTVRRFHERTIGVDAGISRRWGRLATELGHAGADLLIAATALERDFTVVTRNVRHFKRTGVALPDPYELS